MTVGLLLSIGQISESAAQDISVNAKVAELAQCLEKLESLHELDKTSIETKRKKEECKAIMEEFNAFILDPS